MNIHHKIVRIARKASRLRCKIVKKSFQISKYARLCLAILRVLLGRSTRIATVIDEIFEVATRDEAATANLDTSQASIGNGVTKEAHG
jgi:hypothetical protein